MLHIHDSGRDTVCQLVVGHPLTNRRDVIQHFAGEPASHTHFSPCRGDLMETDILFVQYLNSSENTRDFL